MPIDCQWSVTQQSTATGMLFDCQWSVTLLVTQTPVVSVSRNDIPVTVKWPLDCHLADTRLSLDVLAQRVYYYLDPPLCANSVPWMTSQWQSSDIRVTVLPLDCHSNVTWMSLEQTNKQINRQKNKQTNSSDTQVTFNFHWTVTQMSLECHWKVIQIKINSTNRLPLHCHCTATELSLKCHWKRL